MEIFKDVKGYEGLYKVSNLGNVKSLAKMQSNGKGNYYRQEIILKACDAGNGYFFVILYKDKRKNIKRVHQLVAESFLNHTSKGHKIVINHIDLNKKNNKVENLEIVTQRENANMKHLKSSSKYTGVSWNKARSKWFSCIRINGKNKHLGVFTDELKASEAYQKALKKLI